VLHGTDYSVLLRTDHWFARVYSEWIYLEVRKDRVKCTDQVREPIAARLERDAARGKEPQDRQPLSAVEAADRKVSVLTCCSRNSRFVEPATGQV